MASNDTPFDDQRFRNRYDLGLSVSIFVLASLAAGRVYRLPFDDEVTTLEMIARFPFSELANRLLKAMDVHPPLSYLLFSGARYARIEGQQLRWISLGCTVGGLAIWHRLTLESIASAHVSSATRILIAFMFGLIPMAVSQGDALRWYPVLAFMSAVTFFAYLLGGRRWYLCGIPLGLAADTESLAILLFLAIAVERWAFQRRFEWRENVTFAALTGIIALPSVITFVNILRFIQSLSSSHPESPGASSIPP